MRDSISCVNVENQFELELGDFMHVLGKLVTTRDSITLESTQTYVLKHVNSFVIQLNIDKLQMSTVWVHLLGVLCDKPFQSIQCSPQIQIGSRKSE